MKLRFFDWVVVSLICVAIMVFAFVVLSRVAFVASLQNQYGNDLSKTAQTWDNIAESSVRGR
jgi:hypothetical protein